ncbi:MAG: hypothetical protein M3426_01710 [Actinomycetota bacterium]|nr:hypothetical protein [Actinomycetota bacterium]
MRLSEDYVHAFRGPSGVRSACRVRLYLPDEAKPSEAPGDAPLVIVSELADNPGTSVTNAIEQIAAEVIGAHALTRVPVFVEHYPPEATGGHEETFDLVVFAHHNVSEVMRGGLWRKEIGPPTWKHLGRCAVEILVGFSV